MEEGKDGGGARVPSVVSSRDRWDGGSHWKRCGRDGD